MQATPGVLVELNSVHMLPDFNSEIPFADLLAPEQQIHAEIYSQLPGKQLALRPYYR